MIEVYRAFLLSPLADEFYLVKGELATGATAAVMTFSEFESSGMGLKQMKAVLYAHLAGSISALPEEPGFR
jgi:hypothetical protein